jgi:hypothetical protein
MYARTDTHFGLWFLLCVIPGLNIFVYLTFLTYSFPYNTRYTGRTYESVYIDKIINFRDLV